MSKIEEMIKEMCPNGVDRVNLFSVCLIYTGKQLNKANMTEDGDYLVINGGIDPSGLTNQYNEESNTITISQGGASAGYVNWIGMKFWLGAHCYAVHPKKVNSKRYIYHVLKNFQPAIMNKAQGAGIPGLNRSAVNDLEIPLPPLCIQQEIVSVLDKFTDLISDLDKAIEQRQKQYEHFREKLLTFEEGECEWKYVSDVADNFTGLTYKPENLSDTGTLVLRSSNIKDNQLTFDDNVYVQNINIPQRAITKEGDILICARNGSRALIGKCAMIPKCNEHMAFGAFMTILRSHSINNKYLFYAWQIHQCVLQYKGDDAMPINQITSKDFKHIIIPVPSWEKQLHIVATLDKFETLISDLKQMRDLRQKQYEYYREKLLTF